MAFDTLRRYFYDTDKAFENRVNWVFPFDNSEFVRQRRAEMAPRRLLRSKHTKLEHMHMPALERWRLALPLE